MLDAIGHVIFGSSHQYSRVEVVSCCVGLKMAYAFAAEHAVEHICIGMNRDCDQQATLMQNNVQKSGCVHSWKARLQVRITTCEIASVKTFTCAASPSGELLQAAPARYQPHAMGYGAILRQDVLQDVIGLTRSNGRVHRVPRLVCP